jgi:hypothetical protein
LIKSTTPGSHEKVKYKRNMCEGEACEGRTKRRGMRAIHEKEGYALEGYTRRKERHERDTRVGRRGMRTIHKKEGEA